MSEIVEEESGFQDRALRQQGFVGYTNKEFESLRWPLRFTPVMCMMFTIVGVATKMPVFNAAMCVVGSLTFLSPIGGPWDLLYNKGLRHVIGTAEYPPSPMPRRIACGLGGLWNGAVAYSMWQGEYTLALILAGILVSIMLIVNAAHLCLVSLTMSIVGGWFGVKEEPLPTLDEAKAAHAAGGVVIDLRDPATFAKDHIKDARNIPLAHLKENLAEFKDATLLLYCESGIRSKKALGLVREEGMHAALNLGSIGRARSALE